MWFPAAPAKLVPMIVKDCRFPSVMPYSNFSVVTLFACLVLLIFFHAILYLVMSFCHGLLIYHSFLVTCLLFFFFCSFLLLSQHPSLFLDAPSSVVAPYSSPLCSSPYLGIILHELFPTVPRPNITQIFNNWVKALKYMFSDLKWE